MEWSARQRRKIDGGLAEMERLISGRSPARGEYAVGSKFGLGDIAAGTALCYLAVRYAGRDVRADFPILARFCDELELRPSFRATVPVPQVISDKVV